MKLRIVELPYLYETRYVPPGTRNVKSRIVKAFASFQVPTVSSDEAPVSTVWTQNETYAKYVTTPTDAERYFPDGIPVERTRTFEGRTYLPVGSKEGVSVESLASGLREGDRGWQGGFRDGTLPILPIVSTGRFAYASDRAFGNFPSESAAYQREVDNATRGRSVRKVSDDAVAKMAEAAKAWRDGLIVVDGETWASQPDREPHYELHVFPGHPIALGVSMDSRNKTWSVPFRADRRADAVAYGRTLADERGVDFIDTPDLVEVPDPDLLVRDQALMLADRIARNPGMRISNRKKVETWTPEMEEAEDRYLATGKTPDEMRDVEWASEVFSAFGTFRDATSVAGMSEARYASERLVHGTALFDCWEAVEKALRPDVAHPDEYEDVLRMGR